MSFEQLIGLALGVDYPIVGGHAHLYERGLTISGAAGIALVSFAFPMVGRPGIVENSSAPFEADVIHFNLSNWTLETLEPMIIEALSGRLGLVPTGQPTIRIPLTIGRASLVSLRGAYGMAITLGIPLQERQLYDVVIRTEGDNRHVIAPHALYYRAGWTDFGIAHITDMHVARRIDSFRQLLRDVGRHNAANNLYNWNDRFRGFVRYANYLHSIDKLDVVIATGDLYDYLFESDDNPAGGGNAEFLRQLILGQAPGPDFPDVEELRVPIFMVPGNHDYRKNPYTLLFDVTIDLKPDLGDLDPFVDPLNLLGDISVKRSKNFYGYNLAQDDAKVLTNLMYGRSATANVLNRSPSQSARMIEIDKDILPYKTCLADRGSFLIRLGKHRIAMLDSAHDVGVVDDPVDALKIWWGSASEDQYTFVGGDPNCEGVSADELEMVTGALNEVADDGLFIVGIHAPLFNMRNSEYPYFLRKTQRAAHSDQSQVFGYLTRHGKHFFSPGTDIAKEILKKHPLWFSGESNQSAPEFVKRVDSQDILDNGVSRGYAEELMQLLAGVGSRRPADAVLAGHTHMVNEFSVRQSENGELSYYMDFFTQNPTSYYPTTLTKSWRQEKIADKPVLKPVTDKTHVEIVPGAAANAIPWPMPLKSQIKSQLQVPPYHNPLVTTANPRAWWNEHRPLVMQTGALGPLENAQVSFTGFRVMTVKNDVIDKIHYLFTEKLEANHYRLAWDEAIKPEPARSHQYLERSRPLAAPKATGSPAGSVFSAIGSINTVYRDTKGQLHEVWQQEENSGTSNLTDLAKAPRTAGDPTTYIDTTASLQVTLYRGKDAHVHSLYWSTGAVGHDALSQAAGAPQALGNPVGYIGFDGTNHVIYRAINGQLVELWWKGGDRPGHGDLTTAAGAPASAGNPVPYVQSSDGQNIVAYRGIDGHIHTLYWLYDAVGHDNLSGVALSPLAAGDPAAYYTAYNDGHQVTYRAADGHLYELWWIGINAVRYWNITASVAGAPPAASDPVAYYSASTHSKHVVYRSANGHLNEICWMPGGGIASYTDITVAALAPTAAGKPVAFTVVNSTTQQVVYRGTDGFLHEIRWNLPSANVPTPVPVPTPPPPPSSGGGGGGRGRSNDGGKPTQMQ